ncbi:MAG: HAMP domain-containing histidine kinase [Oscillospiraceae bacterium]|nr:HAMP domain-containing histidine kinase [Oscillospiraceae bacterium]
MDTISKPEKKLSLFLRSSQLRFAIAYILITAAVLFFLNIYTSSTMRRMIFNAQQQSLGEKAKLMTTALLPVDNLSSSDMELTINSLDDLRTTRTVVTNAAGVALYDSLDVDNAEGTRVSFPELSTALDGQDVFYSVYDGGAIESRVSMPLMRGGKVRGAVYLMQRSTEQAALIDALQTNVLRISIALEIGVILISLLFSTAFSRRLKRILDSIRKMREGDYSHKLQLRGHDELAHLGREFNNLAERLEESEQVRRQFVSDASHELKTPLASIKLLSDSILQNDMDINTEREFIGDIGREADRLGRLSQKLLTLTRLDSAVEEEREVVDAAATVRKVARMLTPLADLRGITLDCVLAEGCTVKTVEDDLYQVVFNLTENAIKYNRDGGSVRLDLTKDGTNVVLTVADTGVGIPPEAMEHIFERFYRVDKARSRAAGGAGLGLSIVHDMVARNSGTVSVTAGQECGTVFTIAFPLFTE